MNSERKSTPDTSGPATAVRRGFLQLDPNADLLKIARRQRVLIVLAAALAICYCLILVVPFRAMGPIPRILSENTLFAILFATGVTMLLLASAMGVRGAALVLLAIMIVAPGVNVVMLYVLLIEASAFLRFVGVQTSWFGASREAVEFAMRTPLCRACGYNLTGNISGRCPECGWRMPPELIAVVEDILPIIRSAALAPGTLPVDTNSVA